MRELRVGLAAGTEGSVTFDLLLAGLRWIGSLDRLRLLHDLLQQRPADCLACHEAPILAHPTSSPPDVGVTYTGSRTKFVECGGCARYDTNVQFLSNPGLEPRTVNNSVRTNQIAPTVLRALGFDPLSPDAVRLEERPICRL